MVPHNHASISTRSAIAELAVGNMVRRVMHMIREEWEQEVQENAHLMPPDPDQHQRSPPPGVAASAKPATGQGLLSRALRPGVPANRALSLHNLLDQTALTELHAQLETSGVSAFHQMPSQSSASRVRPPAVPLCQ